MWMGSASAVSGTVPNTLPKDVGSNRWLFALQDFRVGAAGVLQYL